VCFENAFDRKQFQKAVKVRTHHAGKIPEKTLLAEKSSLRKATAEKRAENQSPKITRRVSVA
jgi:hypothetical protein